MGSQYPNSKEKFNNRSGPQPDATAQAVNEMLQEFIMVGSLGLWVLIKSLFSRWFAVTIGLLGAGLYYTYEIARVGDHLVWLQNSDPELFTYDRLEWAWKIAVLYHWIFLYLLYLTPIVLFLGISARSTRTKYKKLFESMSLTNGHRDTPKLIRVKKHDRYRKSYFFDANGIGLSEFEDKKERLETHFRSNVESIQHGKNKAQVVITFNKQSFPEKVEYTDLAASHVLPREGFFVGQSSEGIVTQEIGELPHMLIAGTTGGGKSVAFKQILMGLLESSPHLQMYLIDLKGGVEMIDFVKCPNVRVVKTMDDAVQLLRQVEKEMKDRFKYLEAKNRKQIIPEKDGKDRIVLGVDECSVLYMNRNRLDNDYEASLEARQLADSIAKLSRAASIHMILATQKLDRQVLPTSVSENISGRLAFRANSLQGSLVVLGSKDANELPEVPGRGIWAFGTRKTIVQAPFIDEKTIKSRCEVIASMHQKGKKKLLTPMLGEVEKAETEDVLDETYEQLQEDS